jgi:hypothetical protein
MIGIYQSGSVCLSRIAGKILGTTKLLSTTRRLSGWLANPAIRAREWYEWWIDAIWGFEKASAFSVLVRTVPEFNEAFNRHDVAGMMQLMSGNSGKT